MASVILQTFQVILQFPVSHQWSVGVPVISAREIRSGQVDISIAKRIAYSDFEGLRSKCKLLLNDVLFSKTGTIGSVAKVTTNEPLCSAQNIAVLSPLIWPDYLELVLRSPAIQRLAAAGIKTTAIPDVQLGAISRFPIPLPPESEQKRIVTKVTELLSLCDALEAELTQTESASAKLLSATVYHLLQH